MSFKFSIVSLPEIKTAGATIETNMERAMQDCPGLWYSFAARMFSELPQYAEIAEKASTYGISKMIDEQRFYYSASIEVTSVRELPDGIKVITIPAGLYVMCTVPSLAQLGDAYNALYMQWPEQQTEYAPDMQGVSVEKYFSSDPTVPFELYAAICKK